jgi:hypothetical protein
MADIVRNEHRVGLDDLLNYEAPPERIEEMMRLIPLDLPSDVGDEVKRYLFKQVIEMMQLEYGRYENKTRVTEALVASLLDGSIDTHVHGASDPFERSQYEDDIGINATRAKMRAIVIKTWYSPSASRTGLVQRAVDRWAEANGMEPTQIYGGVTLNASTGGINPEAVRKCLGFPRFKYVWMPMADSYWHQQVVFGRKNVGVRFLAEHGKLVPGMVEILRIIADNDLVLACGHYPFEDEAILFEEAKHLGVKHMEAVHPTLIHSKHTISQMKQLADEGVMLGLMGIASMNIRFIEGFKWYIQAIKALSGSIVLGTDSGQIQNPSHLDGLRWLAKVLIAYGVTPEEVERMFKINPMRHLDIH